MPALATIDVPNTVVSVPPEIRDAQKEQQKKKPKASSLCYTPPALINDKKRDRQYFRRGLLGEGGFARCFEVTDFQGTRLAAKCIAKKSITSEKVKMKLLGEIKVQKSMDHPNIVRQRDCFEDEVNVYMILDICTNGTLMDMLRNRKTFTEPEVRYFGIQILGAAKYMHSRRVIHRDLKLGNLFLDENMCIKVGDFGLAALLIDDNDRKRTICGTPNYIAPEVLLACPEGHSYEVDLWSIGVIFYAMLVGKPPFQAKDVKAIYAKIKSNEYEFPATTQVSAQAKDLITSLLCTDPVNRPSIDDIASHQFFKTGIMPRSIPISATKSEPIWPEGQASSIFQRNFNYVTVNAGIGQDKIAGKYQGQQVDAIIDRPEGGRYLPVSLSPRTGPTAKMVNLNSGRSTGRHDNLSDRLRSARLDDDEVQPPSLAQQRLAEVKAQDLRRMTLNTGASRTSTTQKLKDFKIAEDERDVGENPGNRKREVRSGVDGRAPSGDDLRVSHLRGASRAVSEIHRPITRSSRFSQAQVAGLSNLATESRSITNLAQPIRRTTSHNIATTNVTEDLGQQPDPTRKTSRLEQPSRPTSRISRRSQQSPDGKQAVSVRVSPVESTNHNSLAPKIEEEDLHNCVTSEDQEHTNKGGSRDIWLSIQNFATFLADVLASSTREVGSKCENPGDHSDFLHISKWVDYSHRYGLGYQLSDDSTGVYFNDSTSIILPAQLSTFHYIESRGSTKQFDIDAPPKALEKKVYLLKHFKGYMSTHLNSATLLRKGSVPQRVDGCSHMTHYWRTKEGILFRLANGTIQVNFTDHSKIMIPQQTGSADTCRVRFVDTEKLTEILPLWQALRRLECREKLECLADILHTFARLQGRPLEQELK